MSPSLSSNRFALKDWAIVVAALRSGRQKILLRKGGISEGPSGFQVEQSEFWMFPTQFHQSADQIRVELVDQLPEIPVPPTGQVPIDVYLAVTGVEFCQEESAVLRRVPEQILSEQTVRDRFHYRQRGLFVISVEAFVRESVLLVEDHPDYAGCRSWVPLKDEISTEGLNSLSTPQAAP
jgi:hypothetical protein